MRVQKIVVENKNYPLYLLLDNHYEIVVPVMRFIKYLDNTGKSPNTVKTYCYHLKQFYVFIGQRKIRLEDVNFEELANFIGWLRNPTEDINVIDIKPKEAKREESTINAILNAVISFLAYLGRIGNLEKLIFLRMQEEESLKGSYTI